jgi:hypothetical protein
MSTARACLFFALLMIIALQGAAGAERPWQSLTTPAVREVARQFGAPPPEYSLTMWWYWNGDMTEANIRRDLAEMRSRGIRSVMLWPYVGLLNLEYLSPSWFERVAYAVQQARELDMRVWIMDEGCYPSGFVGGKVTRERPWQRMQILLAKPAALGEIDVVPEFRTSATRFIHMPGFRKDETYSLFDALNPAATQDFLADVHEQYRKYIGGEFGRTVLGFMGDEPSFPGVPYTPGIYDEFQRQKGYDVRPHLAKLFIKEPTEEARRLKADYWDVWTGLYRDGFFKPQADWCARQNLEYIAHVCGEEDMKTLLDRNGDYFRCERPVHIPGVDAIWRQIWPGNVADYAKLASSGAHIWGRPRAFSEAYAVYGRGISVDQAKWVLDHHLVRGINLFQAMSYISSREEFRPYFCPPDLNVSPLWPHYAPLFAYANRMSYVLSLGIPAASIALYYPTTSGWLGDFSADSAGLAVAHALLEAQRDFDFVDDDSLRLVLKPGNGTLVNLSGQRYDSVVVPPVKAISRGALENLRALAEGGGHVIFLGKLPDIVLDSSYRDAPNGPAALPWALLEPVAALTPRVLAQFGHPDFRILGAVPAASGKAVRYLHRRLPDAELYFVFNEGEDRAELTLELEGAGEPQVWDAVAGRILRTGGWKRTGRSVQLAMALEPHETRVVVLTSNGPAPENSLPSWKPAGDATMLDGKWEFSVQGKLCSGTLKSWSECGAPGFSGTVTYRREFLFDIAPSANGRALYLDLGTVKYAARVWLNGRDLGALAWGPFRWRLGDAIKKGPNLLEIDVTNTAANELSGDPQRLKEIEEKGWLKNSYFRTYSKFDAEMVPSGLLGPVRLMWYGEDR